MLERRGYLSLVQFSPDPLRFEAVNVGVVLLDPTTKALQFRATDDLGRARSTFPWASADKWWLGVTLSGVEASLMQQHRRGTVADERGLRSFGEALGGQIRLTPPRPIPIREFDADLEAAFRRLVYVPEVQRATRDAATLPVVSPLNDAFRTLTSRLKRVGIRNSFAIEGLGFSVRSDFDYRNGTANLIRLLKVGTSRPGAAVKSAIELGGESVQVDRHLTIDGLKARLHVVVAPVRPSAEVGQVEDEIVRLGDDYPALFVRSSDIPQYAQKVIAEAT